jgi:hypothetical protein
MGFYGDGVFDCKNVKSCPLYPFMPYNESRVRKVRVMSDEAKAQFVERVQAARRE